MADYQYIDIIENPNNDRRKTPTWLVINKLHEVGIGHIQWWGAWRQYCFFPRDGSIILSAGCMNDIQDFIRIQMQIWRNTKIKKLTTTGEDPRDAQIRARNKALASGENPHQLYK